LRSSLEVDRRRGRGRRMRTLRHGRGVRRGRRRLADERRGAHRRRRVGVSGIGHRGAACRRASAQHTAQGGLCFSPAARLPAFWCASESCPPVARTEAALLLSLPRMPNVTAHPTPNPNSLKFTLAGARFIPSGLVSFGAAEEAAGDPLGSALFAVRGIANVFIVPDFVTVTKHPAASWDQLVPSIERILTEHAASPATE